jgi:hypothetical protein
VQWALPVAGSCHVPAHFLREHPLCHRSKHVCRNLAKSDRLLTQLYEIAEKSPQQQFEGNRIRSEDKNLRELLITKCQTITFIRNSSDELP